ncbi:MAG: DUF3365 domain-containing protein [Sphingobacteriales bacterium]|uniref:c-type heme family protein n=1 Tax=Hydrotalea flava TaxID=714549 RepID=UPI00082A8003|nr:DUF3365 domain-containing protein [Hydrotalea flava]RTL51555.1 MAG: DUF3365 domain-containing protein [Sphingobacteriales bacterium]
MRNKIVFPVLAIMFLFSCNNNSNEKQLSNSESKVKKHKEVNLAESQTDYTSLRKKIAAEAQMALAKNLKESIHKGGTVYTMQFCNTQACPITDSMSKILHTVLKRVSDKNRNPANKANENEWAQIELLKENMKHGITPQPKVVELNGQIVGYYPIVTNTLCMQCHGKKGTDIDPKTLQEIHKLYFADTAT